MKVEVFGKTWCAYCDRAKDLLEEHEQEYDFFNVEDTPADWDEMMTRNPAAKTVPQIWIDGEHVGGYDELRKWYKEKK